MADSTVRLRERAAAVARAAAVDAARWDADECFPEPSFELLRESGLLSLTVPIAHGGQGASVGQACVVLEELAVGCFATAMIAQSFLNGAPRAIARLATEAQRRHYLPSVASGHRLFAIAMTEPDSGAAASHLSASLTPDGDSYRLNGTKTCVTGGARADSILVFCRLARTSRSRGIGAVVVDRGQPGFEVVRIQPKMGGRGMAEAELRFTDVQVGAQAVIVVPDAESRRGIALMLRQFNPERCGNAAMTLGTARAALDASIRHTRLRAVDGRPLAAHQGVQWKLADMATRLEAARSLLALAAETDVDGFPDLRLTAMAKIACNEAAEFVCREGIQLHGHAGYTRDLPLERYYRDVRGMSIGGGPLEVMRNIVARDLLAHSDDETAASEASPD